MFYARRTYPSRHLTTAKIRAAIAGHHHEREIARECDPRPRSHPRWRQQRFENSLPTFAAAVPLPDGVVPEDTRLMQDRSPSSLDVSVVLDTLLRVKAVVTALPPTMRAVLCPNGDTATQAGMAAGLRSERTAQRHRRSAIDALVAAGFSEDEVLAALPYLPVLEGKVMMILTSRKDRLSRPMTAEEHEDWRLGWPKNRLARRFARGPRATQHTRALALGAKEAA